jgi:hypothetical protein
MSAVPTDAEFSAQPDEPPLRRPSPTSSLLTLPRVRPASPQEELIPLQNVFHDFGLWHRGPCREVLLQFTQAYTLRDIESMTQTEYILRTKLDDFLVQRRAEELVRRVAEEDAMSFLEFPTRDFQARNRERSSSRASVSSSSSSSSQWSRSSQVSDSDLNDVQQSAEVLRNYLNEASYQLRSLEGGLIKSQFGLWSRLKPLEGQPKELEEAINAALKILHDTRSIMADSGFRKCPTCLISSHLAANPKKKP